MGPAEIIRGAHADGVKLALSPSGTIKAAGDGAAVNRWLPMIREHKAAIMALLTSPERFEIVEFTDYLLDRLKGMNSGKHAPKELQKLQEAPFYSFCSSQGGHFQKIDVDANFHKSPDGLL